MEKDKFDFTYAAPTEEERREIEGLRREYCAESNKQNALERMRRLNRKARLPAEIAAVVLGVAGVLTFGAGLAMSLEAIGGGVIAGSVLGVAGIAIVFFIRKIYRAILKKRKEKYGREIVDLADRLLSRDDVSDKM